MRKPYLSLLIIFLLVVELADGQSFKSSKLQEATIGSLHEAMQSGKLTAVQLVQMYLDRIEAYDKQGPY